MRPLKSCKEYFKDVFKDHLTYQDDNSRSRFFELDNALAFIYGGEAYGAMARWRQEALNEFYGQ